MANQGGIDGGGTVSRGGGYALITFPEEIRTIESSMDLSTDSKYENGVRETIYYVSTKVQQVYPYSMRYIA